MQLNIKQMIFQEIDGVWLAVDSAECKPPILADILSQKFLNYDRRIRLNITQSKE